MESNNRKLALAGIIGTIVYAVADLFLYLGTDIASDSKLSLWQVPEWRLMTSMWIGVIGSLLLLLGFISLARMFNKVFEKAGKFLILPAFLCIGVSMKVFDIVFFDYFILTRTRFFQHFFPETEGCKGWKEFGFNRKQQIRQCILIPVCCLIIALICTFL